MDNTSNPEKRKPLQETRAILLCLRRYFITGTIVILPIAVTVWIIWGLILFLEKTANSVFGGILADVPGVAVIVFFVVTLLVGILATNLVAKRIASYVDTTISRIPLVSKIYLAIQQISKVFVGARSSVFSKVVLVEYPREGIYSLGLATAEAKGEVQHRIAEQLIGVFILTTPNPTTGVLVYVPQEKVKFLDMSLEDGLKLVISAGVLTPSSNRKEGYRSASDSPPEF